MKNVVVIGGGTDLSVMLRGIRRIENIDLAATVTVADDGGSTGRVRRQFHIPTMGDVRNVMRAMMGEESIFTPLIDYRFDGGCDDVDGHNLGSPILTAITKATGSFTEVIRTLSKFLNVKGQIIPSSLQVITLYAVMEDRMIVRGESNIPNLNGRIEKVFYQQRVEPTRGALQAIREADVIVYGIGSLYISTMPDLIADDTVEQLCNNPVKEIYFCNAMTQSGEVGDFTLEGHIAVIREHSFLKAVDIVIIHNNHVQRHILEKYKDMGSEPIRVAQEEHPYQILYRDVLNFDGDLVHHDSNKIRDVLGGIINNKGEQKCRS